RAICFDYQTVELHGIFVLLPTHPRTLDIVIIAVSEDSRGRGIGLELLHFAIVFAKKVKYVSLEFGSGGTGFQQLFLYLK
ncbi:GNAT family N-acetyltransferase, partial [Enterococcus faecalis]|uniref:GNAT family N-acetyltransferase n=1 Tax=Enterococcus faecalis TaxID=1351 RepID=UPI003D6BCF49